eukprot:CAMPEP_0178443452 /NCGR_PEP_ID=MMETSP0689_2-20121128/38906_1 /TAXON_ID=160604 /ORGANISM="Amphidinium massartii, Strain CS-259" /LENGTH=111 /DNA_ID=CAMNT_0020067467 /DNA_START=150 /DNA_END=485 /DNA_ORIENTATION=+
MAAPKPSRATPIGLELSSVSESSELMCVSGLQLSVSHVSHWNPSRSPNRLFQVLQAVLDKEQDPMTVVVVQPAAVAVYEYVVQYSPVDTPSSKHVDVENKFASVKPVQSPL